MNSSALQQATKPVARTIVGIAIMIVIMVVAVAAPAVGAAPKGNAMAVASRIIKDNFPSCRRVTDANRLADGSIVARCDGTLYRVFTVFNPKEGKAMEIAMNCTAAKSALNIDC